MTATEVTTVRGCECGAAALCPMPPLTCTAEAWDAFWQAHPARGGIKQHSIYPSRYEAPALMRQGRGATERNR